jgi:hypothetical protein
VVVGSAGGAPGQFSLPRGVATDVDGNLYVAEGGNNRISKFDANGNFVKTIGGRGGGDGQFTGLSDVAIDPFGNLWVTNTDGRSIDRFDLDGTFISSATSFKNEPIRPASVAAAPDGSIYALNYGTNEVMRFTDDGEPILGKSATVRVVKGTAGEEGCGHGLAPEWRRVQRLRQAPEGRRNRGEEAQGGPPALGQRQGELPHHRPLRLGDPQRDQVADCRPLRRDARARHAGRNRGARPGAQEDGRAAQGQVVLRAREALNRSL